MSLKLQFIKSYAVAFIVFFVLLGEITEHFPCELYFGGKIFLEPDFRFHIFEFVRIAKNRILRLEV